MRELDQRLQNQEARMTSTEGSISNLQQTVSTLVQQLFGFGFDNHQSRNQEVNSPTKPVQENVEEPLIQPNSSEFGQNLPPQFFLRNSICRNQPLYTFVQDPPHQNHYF